MEGSIVKILFPTKLDLQVKSAVRDPELNFSDYIISSWNFRRQLAGSAIPVIIYADCPNWRKRCLPGRGMEADGTEQNTLLAEW